ncbi:uncharacterized protein LOC144005593 [Festucalex cinctus]
MSCFLLWCGASALRNDCGDAEGLRKRSISSGRRMRIFMKLKKLHEPDRKSASRIKCAQLGHRGQYNAAKETQTKKTFTTTKIRSCGRTIGGWLRYHDNTALSI